ncbi:MAG TPA: arylsulfotransferase family protein [Patescibacteria group bacterium]|nr:arylsulfotransferase family protein [Patescibacteria group bacterium]
MILKCICTAILTCAVTYLLSLSADIWYHKGFDYFYASPLRWISVQRFQAQLDKNADPKNKNRYLYFYNYQRDDAGGVVTVSPFNMYGDFTFYLSSAERKAWLIDSNGAPVYEWLLDTAKLPPDPALEGKTVFKVRQPDAVWRAFLDPNDGSVYAMYCGTDPIKGSFVSKGIFKVDKDSNVVWVRRDFIHHDLKMFGDGSVMVFGENLREKPYPGAPNLKTPFAEDFLVKLDQNGKEQWRVSILDLIANSPFKKILREMGTEAIQRYINGDLLHPNVMIRVTAAAAARNPALKEGEYMLSFRNPAMLMAVDIEKGKAVWASYGPWRGQHGINFLDDGTLAIFDNLGNLTNKGYMSRVLDVDTATGEILWQYDGLAKNPVYSSINSMTQPLPNGNILVTESMAGRMFEVTPDKELAWDFRSPVRLKVKAGKFIPNIYSGLRYTRDELKFMKNMPAASIATH